MKRILSILYAFFFIILFSPVIVFFFFLGGLALVLIFDYVLPGLIGLFLIWCLFESILEWLNKK